MSELPKIVHIDLRSLDGDYADLRYSEENLNDFEPRRLPLAEIQDLIETMERDYYVTLPENYATTGRRLYEWIDGSDRFLTKQLAGLGTTVLAIALSERLAHLPWEVMHDGQGFLVARAQPVIPVRWRAKSGRDRLSWRTGEVPNRPLQVLFMATSPAGVEPVLDFEAEEGRILEATKRQPMALTVEESGCLTELEELLAAYEPGYFDGVHFSGHAWMGEGGPRFITETETGDRFDASPDEIARAFRFRFPALMFLSGCRTGQAGRKGEGEQGRAGEVPSMAAALLDAGARAVLGWGRPVRDTDGILSAETLYAKLAGAMTLPEALAFTYQAMIRANAQDRQTGHDWHLLRLYVTGEMPQSLVTPKRTPGRRKVLKPSMAETFLDVEQRVKVPRRESFVGRRRPLQACLRALRDPDMSGVLLYGMGGLGKSSLAARLCDRLTHFERVVLFGPLDERQLVNKLAERVRDVDLRQRLQDPKETLKYRLRDLFEAQSDSAFLLVLDDFEANLEPVGAAGEQRFRLTKGNDGEAARVLGALMWAIEETGVGHRVVLTCRYDFEFGGLGRVWKQPLAGLPQADVVKKCRQLKAFSEKLTGRSEDEKALRERALRLADGNPRLLEWLDKVLRNPAALGEGSVVAVLARLEREPAALREKVLADVLVAQMDGSMREMLGRVRVYELPVPRGAVGEICEGDVEGVIERAVALGLFEESPDGGLRVPRVLPLDGMEDEGLMVQAARVLYRLWWEEGTYREVQALEIHRLAVLGKDPEIARTVAGALGRAWKNKSRFREAVQLCRATLEVTQDFLVFHQLARSEESLGEVSKALENYQRALALCPEEEEKHKAAIIHNLAILKSNQGDVEGATALFQQSLAIQEQIGNVQGKAATLHQLAILKSNQGDMEGVIALFQQSLAITEQIGDVQIKAATLSWLGGLANREGDNQKAVPYLQEALAIFQKIGSPNASAVQKLLHSILGSD